LLAELIGSVGQQLAMQGSKAGVLDQQQVAEMKQLVNAFVLRCQNTLATVAIRKRRHSLTANNHSNQQCSKEKIWVYSQVSPLPYRKALEWHGGECQVGHRRR